MTNSGPACLSLPLDVLSDSMRAALNAASLVLSVPDDYEVRLASASVQSEVLGIQRILTLARRIPGIRIEWQPAIAKKALASPSIFPLLSVLLLLEGVEHQIGGSTKGVRSLIADARKRVLQHRFKKDMFSDADVVFGADSLGSGLPPDLYDVQSSRLREREDIETLIIDALGAQSSGSSNVAAHYRHVDALGVIVAELFENTDMHGRFGLDGTPIRPNCLRGVMFKRVRVTLTPNETEAKKGIQARNVSCFEVSVFDAGVGYFASYTRRPPEPGRSLLDEWKVLHNCLERHYYPDLADKRSGHRAMGLYEVLRALQGLGGIIEIRTGRLYAYRSFFEGQVHAQMKPMAELAQRAWPRPRLLDMEKKYVAIPSEHEDLIGSSVRVIVPLA